MKYQCPYCYSYDIKEENNTFICNACSKQISDDNIIRIIKVNKNTNNGQYRCPKCGASQITFSEKKKALECNFCGCLFNEKSNDENKIKTLKGTTKGNGSIDIDNNICNLVVVKCEGCGSEVVVDANNKSVIRCQWCRSILALNDISESGFSPDKILPFNLTKEEAFSNMQEFMKKNVNYFGSEKYKKDLTIDNIIGVYMPYLVVDVNAHAKLKGSGKHYVDYKKGKNSKLYTVEKYDIEREYDVYIDDLSLESNSNRKDINNENRTNNIINAVMPFDTENAIDYTGNYIIGYNAEKRDLNQKDLEEDMNNKVNNISKTLLREDRNFYNGGVVWSECEVNIKGTKWISFYLPIWLYSFEEKTKNGNLIHYLAVNGRTGLTIGSVPIDEHKTRKNTLIIILVLLCISIPSITLLSFITISLTGSLLIGIISFVLMILLMVIGVCYFNRMGVKRVLRNSNAKYDYEKNTKKSFSNIVKKDIKTNTTKEKK